MANALTGDFDAVVQVGVPSLNRVLATQHQSGAFLHTLSMRIEDIPPAIRFGRTLQPLAPIDPTLGQVESCGSTRPEKTATAPLAACDHFGGILLLEEYTNVRGFADIQISPPTVTLPSDSNGSRLTVHYQIMAHFDPDPGSPAMPEFLHGEFEATVDADQIASQVGNMLDIDLTADNIDVAFNSFWADPPLSSAQSVMVKQLFRNMLRTKFQPVNAALPLGIRQMHFKTLPDPTRPAAAMLLDLGPDAPPNPDPGAVTQVFLGDNDDFAIAVGRDYIVRTLQATIQKNYPPDQPIVRVTIGWWIFSCTWDVYLTSFNVVLVPGFVPGFGPGRIRVTIDIKAHGLGNCPDEYYTVTQFLKLTIMNGMGVLDFDGDPVVSSGGLAQLGNGTIKDNILQNRDSMLQSAQAAINDAFGPDRNLGAVLNALNIPAQLTYQSVEIRTDGVVIHGTLSANDWQRPHVKFTSRTIVKPDGSTATELNALNTWIPGGTIQKYTWTLGAPPAPPLLVVSEQHRFITEVSADVTDSIQWCLEVEGTRITASGRPVEQQVSRSRCNILYYAGGSVLGMPAGVRLPVAVVVPGPGPDPAPANVVVAHFDPGLASTLSVRASASVVIHFADRDPSAALSVLREALLSSSKRGSAVMVVLVVPRGQLERVKPTALGTNKALNLAEDYEGTWSRVFDVSQLPVTLVLNPQGQTVWRHIGQLNATRLTAAFDEHLSMGGRLGQQQLSIATQAGAEAPDFLFEYAQDRCMAFRRLRGRRVLLNFWTSWSAPCLAQLHYLQRLQRESAQNGLLILAINDGEEQDLASAVFEKNGFTFNLVVDRQRQISRLYSINCWPTTISIDGAGLVDGVQYGVASSLGLSARRDELAVRQSE